MRDGRSLILAVALAGLAAPDARAQTPEAPAESPAESPEAAPEAAPEAKPADTPEAPAKPDRSLPPGIEDLTVAEARDRLFVAGRKARFRRATLVERAAIDGLIPVLIDRARRGETRTADLRLTARLAGFVVECWDVHGQRFLVLRERPDDARGAGAYVFRIGEQAAPVILQAPHAYFDVGTGRIAAGMFFGDRRGPRARALFVNTLHRYQRGEPDKRSPADVCHRPDHLFSLATDRALQALPGALVIQLHGFEGEGAPDGVEMILSGGVRETPSPSLAAIADRVRAQFGAGVKLYPTEVDVLGGTTNVQGRLAAAHRSGFVHVEMVKPLRDRLRKDPALRHALARALYGGRP